MKWVYSILLILLCGILASQPHELPVVEIHGDAQVKIPLAKRGPLPFIHTVHSDSLRPFLPLGMPQPSKPDIAMQQPLKGWIGGSVNTDLQLLAQGSLYNLHPMLPHLRLDLDNSVLPQHFKHLDYQAYANLHLDDEYHSKSRLHYQHSRADGYKANALLFSLGHQADSLSDKGVTLHNLDTSLWWENTWQNNASIKNKHHNPGFWHSHRLQYTSIQLENQLGTAMGRLALASAYRLPLEVPGLLHSSVGLMSDTHHVLPSIQIQYEKPLTASLLLQAGNQPGFQPLTRSGLMQLYPWGIQPDLGSAAFSPLDARAQLIYTLPPLGRNTFSHRSPLPLNSITASISSAYTYNQPTLRDSGTPIPIISLEPAWNHNLAASSMLRLPWGILTQELELRLHYLPHQGGIRAPYSPRYISRTSFQYKRDKLVAGISLNQYYNQKDHQGRNLPEVLDLSLSAKYFYSQHLHFEGGLDNILNHARIQWEGLPTPGISPYIRVKYLWR